MPAIILLILAIMLWLIARRARRSTGLPEGVVVYTDMPGGHGWARVEKPLFSASLQLTGKPDYLVRQGNAVVPVEVKSGPAPADGPRAGHVYQLAAYCALVEDAYGHRPDYGLIQYADQTLSVDYTPALEAELLELLDDIRARAEASADDAARSHNSPARCAACGFRDVCDEALA
jgi:CRISPR-associated exonuclease Cas4